MSVTLYDEAVAKKINSWLPKSKDRQLHVLAPDETRRLFSIELDETADEPIKLPLIALSRDNTVDIKQRTMTPMSFDGLMLDSNGKKTLQLDAIPISLSYQLDIYARRVEEADALMREFAFKLINNPQIIIELPYND